MDIGALRQIAGGYTSAVAVNVPVDSRALISEIAASRGLSDAERGSLIKAVAAADSAGLATVERTKVIEKIQMLGIYLRNTGNDGFPRWTMMTALRSYGMNLTEDNGAAQVVLKQAVQQAVEARSVSVETAVAVARAATAVPVQVPVKAAAKIADAPPGGGDGTPRVEKIA